MELKKINNTHPAPSFSEAPETVEQDAILNDTEETGEEKTKKRKRKDDTPQENKPPQKSNLHRHSKTNNPKKLSYGEWLLNCEAPNLAAEN